MAVSWESTYDGGSEGWMTPATHEEMFGGELTPRCVVTKRDQVWLGSVSGIVVDGARHATAAAARAAVERVDLDRVREERPGVVRALGLDPKGWTLRDLSGETVLAHRRHRGVEIVHHQGLWWLNVDGGAVGVGRPDVREVVATYDASDAAALGRSAANGRELTAHAASMAREGRDDWFLDVRDRLVSVAPDGISATYVIAREDGFATMRAGLVDMLRRSHLSPGTQLGDGVHATVAAAVAHCDALARALPTGTAPDAARPPI